MIQGCALLCRENCSYIKYETNLLKLYNNTKNEEAWQYPDGIIYMGLK